MTAVVDGRGTSRSYALRRLARDAPHLHAQVMAGRLSAHAAMVRAGLQPPRFTVVVRSADSVVATLRRRLPADVFAEVAEKMRLADRPCDAAAAVPVAPAP